MKQSKIKNYRPNYPKKFLRGTALAAAALLAVGGAGCKARTDSAATTPAETPIPTEAPEELVLDGEVAIDPGDGEDEPVLEGEPAVDENGDIIMDGPLPDEYVDEYGDPLLGGEPLPDPSWEEENDPAEPIPPDEPEENGEPALMGKIAVPDDMP